MIILDVEKVIAIPLEAGKVSTPTLLQALSILICECLS